MALLRYFRGIPPMRSLKIMKRTLKTLIIACCLSMINYDLASQCINSFPYSENFETSNGGWSPGGTASDWSWGTPIKPVISSAASGTKCWVTGTLTQSHYSNNQNSTLTSPCFDLSALAAPYIRFNLFWETERKYDGASFQYSVDGGNTWTTLGSYADFTNCPSDNWYNTSGITTLNSDGWSGNIQPTSPCAGGAGSGSGQWKLSQHSMAQLAGQANVRFRFRFAAGNVCNNYDGFAVDDIWIGEAPFMIPDFTVQCTGPSTVSFQPVASTCGVVYDWDFGDPSSGAANFSNLTNPTHTYSTAGQYTVSLMLQSAPNPTPVTKQVVIIDVNTVIITPVNCFGDKATIGVQVNPAGNYSYQWNTTPAQTTPVLANVGAGSYTVAVSGANVCGNSDQITITEPPPLNLFLGNDTVICSGQQLLLKAGDFDNYQWQDGSSQDQFLVQQSGLYYVTVTDAAGCTKSDSIRVTVNCSDIFFPTAFTPDNNGLNDAFGAIGNTAAIVQYSLKVFNRWGQVVFQTNDPQRKWNGTISGKPQASQSFAWFAAYTLTQGTKKQQKGTVSLLR